MTATFCLIFETKAGTCAVAWREAGIVRFFLPERSAEAAWQRLRRRLPDATPLAPPPPPPVEQAVSAARRYFEGERIEFADVPLDLDGQDDLFQRIYDATRRTGWGRTTTYGALAKELGLGPEGARDVGQAMAHNPIPLLIPCHRVLAAGGQLGGFSAPGGAETKRRMLEMEGVSVGPPPARQGSLGL